jgi:hypothetical protein
MSKIIDKQLATLILRTADATTINGTATLMTWNNINLQSLLGVMWDQYDLFNIILVEVGSGVAPADLGDSADNLNIAFIMTGLPFNNTRYYQPRQVILNQSIIGFYAYTQSLAGNKIYHGNNVNTFNKMSPIVNITIQYNSIVNDTIASTTSAFPNTTFIFKICGIPKENIAQVDTSKRIKF